MSEVPFAPFRMEANGLAETPVFPDTPIERTRAGAASLSHTAALARTFAMAGRPVDLTGLDGQVGLVCARVLDLSPDEGRALRGNLEGLMAEIDALARAMRLSLAPD